MLNKIFYTKEGDKTVKTVHKWEKLSYFLDTEEICGKCSAYPWCKKDMNLIYGEKTSESEGIKWSTGILCNYKGYCTELLKKEEILEGEKHLLTTDATISVRELVTSFCKKFCPLRQNDLVCKNSLECPFHEFFKGNIEIMTYDK